MAAIRRESQQVPRDWIDHDEDLELSLNEIGVTDDSQLYWTPKLFGGLG